MNDRLQIAAMCLQGLLSNPDPSFHRTPNQHAKFATNCTDALLAECGKNAPTDVQPHPTDNMFDQAKKLGEKYIDLAKKLSGETSGFEILATPFVIKEPAETKRVEVTDEMVSDLRERIWRTDGLFLKMGQCKAIFDEVIDIINGDDQ